MTADTLKNYNCKDLAELARKHGVRGWQSMRKQQLVNALVRVRFKTSSKSTAVRKAARPAVSRTSSPAKPVAAKGKTPTSGKPQANGKAHSNGKPLPNGKPLQNGKPVSNGKISVASSRSPLVSQKPMAEKSNGHGKLLSIDAKRSLLPAKPALPVAKALPPKTLPPKALLPKPIPPKPMLPKPVAIKPAKPLPPPKPETAVARRLHRLKSKVEQSKDLSRGGAERPRGVKDRLVVMVRDPYWLHACWELSRQGVERAQAAIGRDWHAARPILRLMQVSGSGNATAAESAIRDIEIHGGVNNWYIDVPDPPKSYRMDIGYVSSHGKFYVLARSNVVTTPRPGSKDALDENWTDVAENYDKIYALSGGYSPDGGSAELQELFEERLRRPMGSPVVSQFGNGLEGLIPKKREFSFDIDAELIVYGVTEPTARVTLQGDPVRLRPDGSFTVRFSLPNCRQVIPAVASSADGIEQRTIVLAVERNTKVMEPLIRDGNE